MYLHRKNKRLLTAESSHLFVLAAIVIAQPLFAVLANNPAFFTIRHIERRELFILVGFVVLAIPGVLVAFEWIAGCLHIRAQQALHLLLVTALFSLGISHALSKASWISGEQCIFVTLAACAVFAFVYHRFYAARLFMTFLIVGLVAVPLQFLLSSGVRKVYRTVDPQAFAASKPEKTPPIVLIIFDEFPLFPLLNEELKIDRKRYPNIASLTEQSYWFRNATTVSDYTELAIPAILTGKFPTKTSLPSYSEHPQNLFTALAPYYELNAHESVTNLCPEHICKRLVERPSLAANLKGVIQDLVAVYLHLIVPHEFARSLPDISSSWSGFWKEKKGNDEKPDFRKGAFLALDSDRPALMKEFVSSITPSAKPALHFLHILFPHCPWNYLPSGKLYTSDELKGRRADERWVHDEAATTEALRRHILQIKFMDTLIGQLTHHLQEQGLYDETLLIITADHGVSFQQGDLRRPVTATNYYDLLPIPLLVKLPGQKKGFISDNNVEVIDILPSIAEVLKMELPWKLDGISLFSDAVPRRQEKRFYDKQSGEQLTFENNLISSSPSVKKVRELFGNVPDTYDIYSGDVFPELLGRHISELNIIQGKESYELNQWDFLKNVDLSKKVLPAHITGQLQLITNRETANLPLALSVNSVIHSTTKAFHGTTKQRTFSFFLPEQFLKYGGNLTTVYEILPSGNGTVVLKQLSENQKESFSLERDNNGENVIISSSGRRYPIVKEKLRGSIDGTKIKHGVILVWGWGADLTTQTLPEVVVGFIGRHFFDAKKTSQTRNDIAKSFGNWALQSGFAFELPAASFELSKHSRVRFYALSEDGYATELYYYPQYPWKG